MSTHDLFTVAGLWDGSDLASQKKLGLHPNEKATQQLLAKVRRRLHLKADASAKEATFKIHQLLAKAPSKLITVTLDDALQVKERPNLPGTTTGSKLVHGAAPARWKKIKKEHLVRGKLAVFVSDESFVGVSRTSQLSGRLMSLVNDADKQQHT